MTARAIRSVSVDWQVEVQPGAQPATVLDTVHSAPGVHAALPVGFAQSSGFVAQTGGSTQTTGPATVLGIPSNYREQFPDAIRTLVGANNGVLIAQQTAANLHVAPGDTVRIERAGMAPVDVVVDGVVDLPHADSLFQKVGAPPGAQPVAPPDNVVLLGQARWHQVNVGASPLCPCNAVTGNTVWRNHVMGLYVPKSSPAAHTYLATIPAR